MLCRTVVPNRTWRPRGAPCVSRDAESRFCIAFPAVATCLRARSTETRSPTRPPPVTPDLRPRKCRGMDVFVRDFLANATTQKRRSVGIADSRFSLDARQDFSSALQIGPPEKTEGSRARRTPARDASHRNHTGEMLRHVASRAVRQVRARANPAPLFPARARTFRVSSIGRSGNRIVCAPVRARPPRSSPSAARSADPNAPAPVPRPRRRAPCTRPPARSPRTRPRFPWTTPRRRGPR
jgi:hypothetical protein